MQVYYLDVGQATASVIVLPNNMTMIIDTGSSESTESFLSDVNVILNKNKIKKIDFLILTHSDADHVGGAVALLKKYEVLNIYRPKILSKSENEIENTNGFCVVETKIYADVISSVYNEKGAEVNFVDDAVWSLSSSLEIEIFACDKNVYSETNAYSPFIKINYFEKTFLFTGDATEERENEFVDKLTLENKEIDVDFLLVSHHGSKYNSSQAFLEFVSPKFAFISAGDLLHPSNEVLQRLETCGTEKVFCTKTSGTIAVGLDESQSSIVEKSKFIDLPFLLCMLALVLFALLKCDFGFKIKYNNFVFLKK